VQFYDMTRMLLYKALVFLTTVGAAFGVLLFEFVALVFILCGMILMALAGRFRMVVTVGLIALCMLEAWLDFGGGAPLQIAYGLLFLFFVLDFIDARKKAVALKQKKGGE